MISQRAVLLSAVTIAAIVGVVLIVSLTAGLEEEYKEVWTMVIIVMVLMLMLLMMILMYMCCARHTMNRNTLS